jgi:uncharacterized damage-inducible protein DinB
MQQGAYVSLARRATAGALPALAFALTPLASNAQTAAEPAGRLAWLAGCWDDVRGGRTVEEQWMAPRGGVLLGMGRTSGGARPANYEQMRIEEREGKLVFVARPSGQPEAAFTQVELTDSLVAFENPTHDFPQRIVYRLKADGSLLATTEGRERGQRRSFDFPLRRAACASSAAVSAGGAAAAASTYRTEILRELAQIEDHYTRLAAAMPPKTYTWRPAAGVRSVSEVFLHVAAANYNLPRRLGTPPPEGFAVQGYETSTSDEARVRAMLARSFTHLRGAVERLSDADAEKTMPWLGGETITYRGLLLFITRHLGEHLGQSIAYARVNGVVPPWSGEGR